MHVFLEQQARVALEQYLHWREDGVDGDDRQWTKSFEVLEALLYPHLKSGDWKAAAIWGIFLFLDAIIFQKHQKPLYDYLEDGDLFSYQLSQEWGLRQTYQKRVLDRSIILEIHARSARKAAAHPGATWENGLLIDESGTLLSTDLPEPTTNLILPDSVHRIGYQALSKVQALERLELPAGLTFFRIAAGVELPYLKEIDVREASGQKQIYWSKAGVLYSGKTLIRCPAGYEKREIHVPVGITVLDDDSFSGCKNIERVVFNELEFIFAGAFMCCPSLKELVILGSGCEIETEDDSAVFDEEAAVVIFGVKGGPAERFAKRLGFEFKVIEM